MTVEYFFDSAFFRFLVTPLLPHRVWNVMNNGETICRRTRLRQVLIFSYWKMLKTDEFSFRPCVDTEEDVSPDAGKRKRRSGRCPCSVCRCQKRSQTGRRSRTAATTQHLVLAFCPRPLDEFGRTKLVWRQDAAHIKASKKRLRLKK